MCDTVHIFRRNLKVFDKNTFKNTFIYIRGFEKTPLLKACYEGRL